jgi:hypothetical protein
MRMLRITGVAAAVIAILPFLAAPAQADAASTGAIEGRIIDQSGAGADATVIVHAVDDSHEAYAYTWDLGDGRYRIQDLPPGQYQVSLHDNLFGTQWVPGKETREEATVFTVGDGETVTVDDQWLPMGTVKVRVRDAETGRPVPEPCVLIDSTPRGDQVCGAKGLVVLDKVPPGSWMFTVSGGVSYFPSEDQTRYLTVERGRTTSATVTLAPAAAIKTRVVDAATGAPLAGICARLVDAVWSGMSASMGQSCSDTDGSLEFGPYPGGWTVNLYAYLGSNPWEPPTVRYGDQWVSADGGTGDQRRAIKVKMVDRRTKVIPAVRMDPPATITGTVRDAVSGAPVSGVCAYPYAWHPGQGGIYGKHCSNAQGTYTIDDVGPYSWPVEYTPYRNSGYAWQWSGDVADRFAATYTRARVGAPATVDAGLVRGGSVVGTVTDGTELVRGAYVAAYNRRTRDYAGPTWAYSDSQGAFSLPGFRTQKLWVEYYAEEKGCWYGTGPAAPTPVPVTAGEAGPSVAFDLTTTCAPSPVAGTTAGRRAPASLLTAGK